MGATDDGLKVEQADISGEVFEYFGVISDAMNRRMETVKRSSEKK